MAPKRILNRLIVAIASATVAAALFSAMTSHAVAAEAVTKADTYGDWTLYADAKSPHLFCFVTSEPKSSEPADTAREQPRVYISAWPKDGVKGEVSFRLGFPAKKNSEVTASVAPAGFKLFASDDRAYVQDATQELKMLEAMKKGAKVTVSASTQTGVAVTDSYSLSGLGQAMGQLQSTCF